MTNLVFAKHFADSWLEVHRGMRPAEAGVDTIYHSDADFCYCEAGSYDLVYFNEDANGNVQSYFRDGTLTQPQLPPVGISTMVVETEDAIPHGQPRVAELHRADASCISSTGFGNSTDIKLYVDQIMAFTFSWKRSKIGLPTYFGMHGLLVPSSSCTKDEFLARFRAMPWVECHDAYQTAVGSGSNNPTESTQGKGPDGGGDSGSGNRDEESPKRDFRRGRSGSKAKNNATCKSTGQPEARADGGTAEDRNCDTSGGLHREEGQPATLLLRLCYL